MLVDKPGWAYDINSKGLRNALSDEFDIEIKYMHFGEKPDLRPDHFDVYHVCCWVDIIADWHIDPSRVIKEVSSHRWEDPGPYGPLNPKQFCEKYLSDAGVVTATSKRLQNIVSAVRPCFLAPNGVNDLFDLRPARGGALTFGWAGNADDPCKGLRDIIIPAAYNLIDLAVAPGNVAHTEMKQFYHDLDVICIASTKEGEPLPLLEAMRCGCFPICTDVGIVPELVRHGQNGLIVERTPEAFRRAFHWCLGHVEQVREAGVESSDFIRKTRSWEQMKGAWRRAWCAALAQQKIPPPQRNTAAEKGSHLINCLYKSIDWIEKHSIAGGGIAVSSDKKISYPEVTGYYIPTLLSWGERERAVQFGKYLLTVQRRDGAFAGPDDKAPYCFDTGQVVRGLLALTQSSLLDCRSAIEKACEWMTSLIQEDGRPEYPDIRQWAGKTPVGVLLYALEPVRRAAIWLDRKDMATRVDKCVAWFLRDPALTDFTSLSHFHAYILEALFDLGFTQECQEGIDKVMARQQADNAVPGYANVSWTCSTGMFQYACILFKLGQKETGDACFRYMLDRQNQSGGWFGSYGPGKAYFPSAEISWAVKYFLDAFSLRQKISFEALAPRFLESIDSMDGRYLLVREHIQNITKKKMECCVY